VLEEVRNGTGYVRTLRSADALVCSCWPSRGLWLAGVEIKVSRSDWLREIKDPAKSSEIQRWCHYWWIAAPAGLVHDGELPKTWGLLEHASGKLSVKVQAPKLEAEPPSMTFLASVLRSTQAAQDRIVSERVATAVDDARAACGGDRVLKLEEELLDAQIARRRAERDLEQLQEGARELAQIKACLGANHYDSPEKIEQSITIGARIRDTGAAQYSRQLRDLAESLERLAP
jgi:hypothetical protein